MSKFTLLPHDFNQHPGIYLTALILSVIAIVYIGIINPILQKPVAVSNFAECAQLPESIIQEKYPPVCVTSDGQQFTQPIDQASSSATPTK